ncbi:enoyl-CoA hydratase/isomerase family protein [Ideonella sp. YS5]|uniref:enoyl-CoA hydratase/isomerase family protein n=1 Tax=Ideonella sp. YS5 TaxID=3453714 RepID=UPI003EEE0672
MSTPPVLLQRDGAIANLRLNRPGVLNAADGALALAFRAACLALEADSSVRVVVVSGEGRAFMAGGDIAQFREAPHAIAETLIDPLHEGLQCLVRMRAPVIASLHGAVAGAGLSLAMACDLAVAAEGTRFSFAYAQLGASCDLGGSWHLPRLVGLRRALEISLLGDTMDAAQALQLGLVNRVVPADSLADETRRLATRLAAGAPVALGQLKRLMRESWSRDLATQLGAERAAFEACVGTQDFHEGVEAFLAKRAPRYEGR